VIERVARCVRDAVDECHLDMKRVRAVGIGAPGAVNPEEGRVIFAPNLDWRNTPLEKALAKLLGTAVFVENDCNACALGVYHIELKAKPKTVVGIFIGTGVGGGVIINGELHSGFNRAAGEVGHMVIQVGGPKCNCGSRGCFEAMAGRTAIFRRIQAAVKEGQKTILTDMLGPDLDDLRSGDLRKAIKRGDKFVEKVIKEAAQYTGIAVGSLLNILNPDVVVLGGGLIQQLAGPMMPIIVDTAKAYAMAGTAEGIRIVASDLGDDAGIYGAAVVARVRSK
jgi:glucokinase